MLNTTRLIFKFLFRSNWTSRLISDSGQFYRCGNLPTRCNEKCAYFIIKCIYLFIYLFDRLFDRLFVCLFIYLFIYSMIATEEGNNRLQ